jgi:hypothetical protein
MVWYARRWSAGVCRGDTPLFVAVHLIQGDTLKFVDLFYPSDWLASRNPASMGLNRQTRNWAFETGLIRPQDTELDRMREALDPEAFVGWVHPLTRCVDFLRLITDFTVWIVVLDDELEKITPGMGSEERAELLRGFETMMEGGDAPRVSRYSMGFHDLVSRLGALVGGEHGPRLTAQFRSMLAQMLWMVVWEEPKASLSWQDRNFYEAVRPKVTQFFWYFLFVQIADNCYLPEAVVQDPRVERLSTLGSLIFGLINDIVSVSTDDTGQPVMNAVLIHKYRERCDQAEAIAAVARWHNECVAELVRAARTAAEGAGASGHDVETYARGIQNTLRGAVEWMLRVNRYTVPASCQLRIVSKLGEDEAVLAR